MFDFLRRKQPPVYLLMDSNSRILAKGDLQGELTDRNLQMKIVEGTADSVVEAGMVEILSNRSRDPILMGQVIQRRGNLVVLEPMRQLDEEVRRNFRMPVVFESFLYLPEGGRYLIRSIDLSCGGIAFYSAGKLDIGARYEVVIPITMEAPLIPRCQVLRAQPYMGPIFFYACKFVDMIDDEETMIREAVFNVQLETIRIAKQVPRKGR